MTTKIPVELSSTPGIVDGSNATAITIDSSENVMVGATSYNNDNAGIGLGSSGFFYSTRSGSLVASFNRLSSDGTVVDFRNDSTVVGGIGVASSDLTFETNSTERMRIDSSGNIGIGITSPAQKLDVNGYIKATRIGAGISPIVPCEVLSTGATSTALRVLKSGSDDSTQNNLFSVTEISGHGRLSIHDTSQNEDIRLDSNGDSYFNGGNFGIGTSSPAYQFHLKNTGNGTIYQMEATGGNNIYKAFTNSGGTSYIGTVNQDWNFLVGGTVKFEVTSSGGSSVSDEKFKENIQDISYGLDTVKALKPRHFKWKDSQEDSIGFIAQEVKPIISEVINVPTVTPPEGMETGMSMNYSALTAVLTKAIQEQQAIIEDLQTQINEVKNGN